MGGSTCCNQARFLPPGATVWRGDTQEPGLIIALRGHGLMGKMPEPGRVPAPGGHSLVGEVLALGPYGKAGSGPVQH